MHRDTFLALASVIWADDVVMEPEARALREAARAVELEGDDLAAVEAAIRTPPDLDALDLSEVPADEAELIYSIACWLSAVDGSMWDAELMAVEDLAERLGLDEAARQRAAAASKSIAVMAEGNVNQVLHLLDTVDKRRRAL